MNHEQRKKEIEDKLMLIAGIEVSLRLAIQERDRSFINLLTPLRQKHYKELRRIMHGLTPQEGTLGLEENS